MRTPESPSQHVLVLSPDPVAAALLGMFVELASYLPAFAQADERPEEAVARVRPLAVVLLDGSLEEARSDLFFAVAARARVGVAIFGAQRAPREISPHASARGVPAFAFPTSVADLERMLRQARATRWWARAAERRRARPMPFVELGAEGELLYHDHDGRRWNVYDRRGGDRRRAEPAPVERVFVSETGEIRTCQLAVGEAAARDPDQLAAQLARAVPARA